MKGAFYTLRVYTRLRVGMISLPHLGDMLAIPFFLWLVIYFYRKDQTEEGLTLEERCLYLFCISGVLIDTYFVFCVKY